jgi:hypothetical protein
MMRFAPKSPVVRFAIPLACATAHQPGDFRLIRIRWAEKGVCLDMSSIENLFQFDFSELKDVIDLFIDPEFTGKGADESHADVIV